MQLYVYILIVVFVVLITGMINTREKYTDLWDANKVENDMKNQTKGLFDGIKSFLEGAVKIFEPQIPGKKPCPDGMSDDKTSCWKHTYVNGVGTIPEYNPCPPRSRANWAQDCIADGPVDREHGNNTAEAIDIIKYGLGRGGCSWNRHVEGGMCFRDCPNGYFGRAHERCWANGADSFGVMRRSFNRGTYCPHGKVNVAGLCYNRCRSGYSFKGGNLCEPDGGPGIKVTAFERYQCPPPGKPEFGKLVGALCYKSDTPAAPPPAAAPPPRAIIPPIWTPPRWAMPPKPPPPPPGRPPRPVWLPKWIPW